MYNQNKNGHELHLALDTLINSKNIKTAEEKKDLNMKSFKSQKEYIKIYELMNGNVN